METVRPARRALLGTGLVVAVPILVLLFQGPGMTFWVSLGGGVIGAVLAVTTQSDNGRRWLADPTTRVFLLVTVLSVALPIVTLMLWGTGLVFRGVVGPCGIGLVMGAVVLIDRWRAPLRNIYRVPAIGSERDFRDVAYQVDRLVDQGEWTYAYHRAVAICTWLQSERHYGSRRRQQRLSAALGNWTARRDEYNPLAELAGP